MDTANTSLLQRGLSNAVTHIERLSDTLRLNESRSEVGTDNQRTLSGSAKTVQDATSLKDSREQVRLSITDNEGVLSRVERTDTILLDTTSNGLSLHRDNVAGANVVEVVLLVRDTNTVVDTARNSNRAHSLAEAVEDQRVGAVVTELVLTPRQNTGVAEGKGLTLRALELVNALTREEVGKNKLTLKHTVRSSDLLLRLNDAVLNVRNLTLISHK